MTETYSPVHAQSYLHPWLTLSLPNNEFASKFLINYLNANMALNGVLLRPRDCDTVRSVVEWHRQEPRQIVRVKDIIEV